MNLQVMPSFSKRSQSVRRQTLLQALIRKGRYVNRVIDKDKKTQLVARTANVALLNSLESKLASVCSPKMARAG